MGIRYEGLAYGNSFGKNKKKRKYKLLMFIIIVFLVIFIKSATGAEREIEYREVVVEQGDTLWAIASNNLPPGYDIRKYVWLLQQENGIDGGAIYPGQIILMPMI